MPKSTVLGWTLITSGCFGLAFGGILSLTIIGIVAGVPLAFVSLILLVWGMILLNRSKRKPGGKEAFHGDVGVTYVSDAYEPADATLDGTEAREASISHTDRTAASTEGRAKLAEFDERWHSWLEKQKYVTDLNAARLASDKKSAVSIGKATTKVLGFFARVPAQISFASTLSSLSGSETDFQRALDEVAPYCDILGLRIHDGRIWTVIHADEVSPNDALEQAEEIYTRAQTFHDLLPMYSTMSRMTCFVHTILVYSRSEPFDAAKRELRDVGSWRSKLSLKEYWRSGAMSARYHQMGFVDLEGERIEFLPQAGIYRFLEFLRVGIERVLIKVFGYAHSIYPRPKDLFESI